ncbi:MAG: helicase [Herminiimonas sp.]|nr:helicase [Herminiimonas sp.]
MSANLMDVAPSESAEHRPFLSDRFATRRAVTQPGAKTIWRKCIPLEKNHSFAMGLAGTHGEIRVYPADEGALVTEDDTGERLAITLRKLDGCLLTVRVVSQCGETNDYPIPAPDDAVFMTEELQPGRPVIVVVSVEEAIAIARLDIGTAIACLELSRTLSVVRAVRAKLPAAHVLLVPERGAESDAERIANESMVEWCSLPLEKPERFNVSQFIHEYGSTAFMDLINRPQTPQCRFALLSVAKLSTIKPLRWAVQGIFPTRGLGAIFGPSGGGKSFLALDLALSLASGNERWFGRRVRQLPVIYCVLEGAPGMSKRVLAWERQHGTEASNNLKFLAQDIDLTNPRDVDELAYSIRLDGASGGVVIVDTLNRAATGLDENSSADMSLILSAARRIEAVVDGLVLLVHHTGKDASKGPRGHSSFYAALDGAIEVGNRSGQRQWWVAKAKDDEVGDPSPFELSRHVLSIDEDGEEETSCAVAELMGRVPPSKRARAKGKNEDAAVKAIDEQLAQLSVDAAGLNPGIAMEDAIVAAGTAMPVEEKRKRERAKDAIESLVARGVYRLDGAMLSNT